MKRSWLRGQVIVWNNGKWVYEDDYSDIPANGGEIRPCIKCKKLFSLEECDPCLGILPGVNNACCGHGIKERSYIRFKNGISIIGFEVNV